MTPPNGPPARRRRFPSIATWQLRQLRASSCAPSRSIPRSSRPWCTTGTPAIATRRCLSTTCRKSSTASVNARLSAWRPTMPPPNQGPSVAHLRQARQQRRAGTQSGPQLSGLLAELNRYNCVVLDGARTRVLRFEEVEHDAGVEHYAYRVPTSLRFEDFRNLYLNRRIVANGQVTDVGKFWLTHEQRRQYPGIIFKPNGEPIINGKLNLWRGWGVEP